MDLGFLKELEGIIGKKEKLSLPRVFIGGRYIGGAEEIRGLHENGELKKIVDGLPVDEIGVCDNCGGFTILSHLSSTLRKHYHPLLLLGKAFPTSRSCSTGSPRVGLASPRSDAADQHVVSTSPINVDEIAGSVDEDGLLVDATADPK
ncbi:hypothetical protein IFM89_012869 [Coptis chinensis]|uniref:Glutaredoxin domain-containing protein n=1 Tax=Coptis chinensis TaxID=261450 RepID=A0A835HCP5_9MAGN|nr:hypothetical protein IFM89_012869 [Coptis chinensis]